MLLLLLLVVVAVFVAGCCSIVAVSVVVAGCCRCGSLLVLTNVPQTFIVLASHVSLVGGGGLPQLSAPPSLSLKDNLMVFY